MDIPPYSIATRVAFQDNIFFQAFKITKKPKNYMSFLGSSENVIRVTIEFLKYFFFIRDGNNRARF